MKISGIYTNAQGLINNFSQVEIIAALKKPDYIILSETHLTKNIGEQEYQLAEYDHYATLSNSTRTGGVIVYFRKSWKVNKFCEKVADSKYWMCAYLAKNKNTCLVIMAVYRSPSCREVEFCDAFDKIIETICETNYEIVIAGDFNIDWSKDETYKNRIQVTLNDNGLKQIVTDYTRVTKNTKTIIDYVITNNYNIYARNNGENKIADHEAIDITIPNRYNEVSTKKEIEIFKYNKNLFSRELYGLLKYDENEDINNNAEHLDTCFDNTIRKFTKKKTINQKNNVNKWFSRELKLLKREKITKYYIAKSENTNVAWNNYKQIRNKYKTKIIYEKNKFINHKISNAKDQKQMWKEIKDLVLNKNKNVIQNVIFNNIEYKENLQIASHFNKYFVDSIKSIRTSIEQVQYVNQIHVLNSKFKFREINLQELKNICKDIKNKPDFNNVSMKLVMDNWEIMGEIMMKIINKSLQTGEFPETWKISSVTPIEKIPKTNKCEEFRPINTLKTCEKIIEKVVKQQLENYFEENNIFSKYQSGFRKKFSCETTINYVINRWKNMEKNNKIMAIFLDFKRAFETIDRDILIQKLYMYGIQGNELKWFKSYLANRKQMVKLNNIKSSSIDNEYGVPQGSILGALLFIIYINDMPNVLQKCEIILYADDTLIFTEGHTDKLCQDNMIHDINNVNKWLKMNKLKLNENKTKLMEINMNNESVFKINNEVIEKVNEIKYLGFIIDKQLKFKEHMEYICKKIGKKIGFFKRIRNKISILTAINIYNTTIKPHFEFGSTILYTCCTSTQIERLQKLQNKAMRSILKCNIYTPIESMLNALKWLNIKQRLEMNTLHFIQKMKTGNAPEYLIEQLNYVREIQPYHLRNADNFRLPKAATTAMQRSLFYKGLHLYNMLPMNVKSENNTNEFKRKIVYFIKNNIIYQSF